jgi:hypothetical protein
MGIVTCADLPSFGCRRTSESKHKTCGVLRCPWVTRIFSIHLPEPQGTVMVMDQLEFNSQWHVPVTETQSSSDNLHLRPCRATLTGLHQNCKPTVPSPNIKRSPSGSPASLGTVLVNGSESSSIIILPTSDVSQMGYFSAELSVVTLGKPQPSRRRTYETSVKQLEAPADIPNL